MWALIFYKKAGLVASISQTFLYLLRFTLPCENFIKEKHTGVGQKK